MATEILVVDDEQDMLVLLKRIITEKTPHEVTVTNDPLKVGELLKKHSFALVITDLKMPRCDGIQVLETVKQHAANIAVIIMTAYGTIESAIEATRKGAFDYVTKPFRKERILHVIDQALKWQQLEQENTYLREKLQGKSAFTSLIGNSPAMQRLHSQIEQVARTNATILITGESGTGKELVARAIHQHSLRRDKVFTPIDCSTIPESLMESELFGHLRGSFTGALKDKKGLVEETNHGTLFLDEIGDLNLTMQVKLLRLLQEGEYKVVGDTRIRKVDLRFLAATHQNLADMIRKSEFREDLFYRLNVINIHLPPLRERREDIPLLAAHFLHKYAVINARQIQGFSREAMTFLVRQEWPGNIRELENVVERGVILGRGDMIGEGDLSMPGVPGLSPAGSAPMALGDDLFALPFKEAKNRLLEDFQSQFILKALASHGGNVSQTAREVGVKRQYLHRLIRDANLNIKPLKKAPTSEDPTTPNKV
jgi:DNA-binding NtrC family response regulator